MNDFQFKPFGRKVLVEITGKMSLTNSSTIIQADSVQAPLIAKVIEVGDGEYAAQNGVFIPTRIAVGDEVLLLDGDSGNVRSHGKDLILLNEDSIIGVVSK